MYELVFRKIGPTGPQEPHLGPFVLEAVNLVDKEHASANCTCWMLVSFADLKITALGTSDALCVGNWHLERAKQPTVGGVFSLIFTKTNDGWKIIHDHTSVKLAKTDSKKS